MSKSFFHAYPILKEKNLKVEGGERIVPSCDPHEPIIRCHVLLLPIELTILIFEEACAELRSSPGINTEVAISHVCRSWRSISLSCPQLWTSFKHDGRALKTPIQRSRVETYIERSQNFDLDFSFEGDEYMDLLEVIQLALVPNAFRLRRLAFCISDTGEYVLAVLELFEFLSMDSLEIFEIQLQGTDWLGDLKLKTFYFKGHTPRLKAFRTDIRLLHISPPTVLRNLTDLQLDAAAPSPSLSWSRFLSFSMDVPTLTTLSVSASIFSNPSHLDLQAITFPNLRYLRCRDDAIGRFMSHFLRAPLLEQLILHDLHVGRWADTSEKNLVPVNTFPCIKMVAFININCEAYNDTHNNGETYDNRNTPLFALAQATYSASHIIVSHNNATNMDVRIGIARYLADLDQEPMLWQHLEILSCLDKFMSKDVYTRYLDVMRYRSNVPGFKNGKLRILEQHINHHQVSAGEVIGEKIVVEAIQGGEDALPWPNDDLFQRSAEELLCQAWCY